MEEEGEAGSPRERVEVSPLGKGAYENANMQEDEKPNREDLVSQENFSIKQQGAVGERLTEPEGSISQNPSENMDAIMENSPILTPDKIKPEFVNSTEILVPNNETKCLEENFLNHESTSYDSVDRQESIECRSFLESDDYSESAPTDNVSEMSNSVKNYSAVDDEGATPQFDDKREILGKESEDVMDIAERLSQLRSIGKTADSARKYILQSDTGMEDLDLNDRMSDLLGPKRLDFEVIDFDQFGAQPPDLPLNNNLAKANHHGGISSANGGKGIGPITKAKKPEHHVRVLDARNEFEHGMKGLNDSPVKISLKHTPEKKQLRKERGAGGLDLPKDHVIPRLCNALNAKEDNRGHDVSRDLDSHSIVGRSGNSKLRLLDSALKPKKISEAPSGSPIRRSKSTMPEIKGPLVHEEARKHTEELQQLTQMQAKRLENYCYRVDLTTAQLEEQSRMHEEMHEELNHKLEAECGERLKSEEKLMVLCEMLPNMEEKLKNLCDQMLFMEVQLQEQVDLRNQLEEAWEREHHERVHLAAKFEEQVDLRNKLEDDFERERQERVLLAAKLEEQVDLRNKLGEDWEKERRERMHLATKLEEQVDLGNRLLEALERECQERMHFVAKLEEQVDLRNKLGEDLEQERQERLQLAAKLEEQVDSRNKLGEDWEQERQERLQLAAKLEEQVDSRNKLGDVLAQERKQRTRIVAQLEQQIRLHGELACKLEEQQDERLKSEAGLMVLREMLPNVEETLENLNNKIESLIGQLQEQTAELREELKQKMDQQCKERMQHMAKMEDQAKMHAELEQKFEEGRDGRLKSETDLKELRERLPQEEEKLQDLQNQVLSLAMQLQEQIELRKELEERLDREREEKIQNAVIMSSHATESLPISSILWSEEKIEFAKLLDEQKTLLANQVKEAAILKNATEKKVGLLNHQVQNLEVLSQFAETMEYVFNAKKRAIRQTMWTVFQAFCLGMVLMNFIVSCRNPLQSSLQPT